MVLVLLAVTVAMTITVMQMMTVMWSMMLTINIVRAEIEPGDIVVTVTLNTVLVMMTSHQFTADLMQQMLMLTRMMNEFVRKLVPGLVVIIVVVMTITAELRFTRVWMIFVLMMIIHD